MPTISNKNEELQKEIKDSLNKLQTDGYKMSIGEIVTLYKDGEIELQPDFQRYYRWGDIQKSKLIESILLKIPIPPIYVSELENSKWEVIDGLQRISTILEFMNVLKHQPPAESDTVEKRKIFKLKKTKLLPSLEGYVWDKNNDDDSSFQFPDDLKVAIKRAHLTVEIIKKESSKGQKYELFERLNTLGSKLSDQEIRNCLLIMLHKPSHDWLEELSKNEDFKNSISSLSKKQIKEREDMELILRLVAMLEGNPDSWKGSDLRDILGEEMKVIISEDFNKEEFSQKFNLTFRLINQSLEGESFRRFYEEKDKFQGAFLPSAFECISYGVLNNLTSIENKGREYLSDKIKSLWKHAPFTDLIRTRGLRSVDRLSRLIPIANEYFKL